MNRCVRTLLALAVVAAASCGGDGGVDTGTSPTGGDGGPGCSLPATPGNVAATVTGNNVLFTWGTVNNIRDYEVRVGTTPGDSNVISTNTTHTNYAWNGAASGTFYLRVNARNTCGSGPSSNPVTFTV